MPSHAHLLASCTRRKGGSTCVGDRTVVSGDVHKNHISKPTWADTPLVLVHELSTRTQRPINLNRQTRQETKTARKRNAERSGQVGRGKGPYLTLRICLVDGRPDGGLDVEHAVDHCVALCCYDGVLWVPVEENWGWGGVMLF